MVRRLVPLLAIAAACAVAAPAAQAETLSGTLAFKVKTLRPADPCAGGFVLCGPVTIPDVGTADFGWSPTAITGEEGSCLFTEEVAVFAFSPDDVLVLDIAPAQACFPGQSPFTPGSAHSWGNPVTDTGTWTVSPDSTGIFAGATGSGTSEIRGAGGLGHITFTGTVTY